MDNPIPEPLVGILLTPGFLEVEAALALEACRQQQVAACTVARARSSLEGMAGAIWTPKYAFPACPPLRALVIAGGSQMRRQGLDLTTQTWLRRLQEGPLKAVFLGGNAALLWHSFQPLSLPVAARSEAAEALSEAGLTLSPQAVCWEGPICSTQGGPHLAQALQDWLQQNP